MLAEVRQPNDPGSPLLDRRERLLPGLQVDLGRRAGRVEEVPGRKQAAERVARVADAVGVEEGHVVPGVPGRRHDLEPEHARTEHADVLRRHRSDRAEQAAERLPVEAPRAALEPLRVDKVRGAYLVDVHLEGRVSPHELAGCARVIGVDVREQDVPQVREREAEPGEARLEHGDADRRTAVDERELRPLEEIRGDHALVAEVAQVEQAGPRSGQPAAQRTASRIFT